MEITAIIIGVSNIFCGALVILLSLPLLRGDIRRNRLYGVRFRESFVSDEAWTDINRYGAKRLIAWSLPLIVLGVVTLFLPLGSNLGLVIGLSMAPLIVIVPAIESWRYAKRHASKS